MASELGDSIPTFGSDANESEGAGLANMSALSAGTGIKSGAEILGLILIAVALIGGLQFAVVYFDVPAYVFPKPSGIFSSLYHDFPAFWPHIVVTLRELLVGLTIGSTAGILMAAIITQFPYIEKIVTPYVLLLVCTPMIALVPLLMLNYGFGSMPRYIAVTLASFPMVMINAATGFRRTDLAKIALAKSYGANTFQIFMKIRFPLALPMVIVGLMVGSIFGLLTAVGAEMVGGQNGLGNQLQVYASLIRMEQFWAIILILAMMGVSIYVIFFWVGKKWASWQA